MFLAWSPMRSIALAIHDLERGRDGARVFHHVGDELAQDRAEFRSMPASSRITSAASTSRRAKQSSVRRSIEIAASAAWRTSTTGGRYAALVDVLRHARDLLRLVADALEVGHRLHDGEDHAQVAGRGLAAHDDLAAVLVESTSMALTRWSAAIILRKRDVAGRERIDRAPDLRLHQPAHGEHARADRAEIEVVLLRRVRSSHG